MATGQRLLVKITRESLPQVKDKYPFIYLERGRLEVDDSSVKWIDADNHVVPLPVATLNALLLGEGEARHLGVNVQTLKRRLILLTAAGVGVAVAVSGMIGFVGLVVPHLVRLLAGPNHVRLLPLSALLGAALLLAADMLARTLLAPAELPVGIITALLGAPFFIWLLVKGRRAL